MSHVQPRPESAQAVRPGESAAMRRAMVDSQLRVSGIDDKRLIAALLDVAREDFVPEGQAMLAYRDRAVPLAEGAMLNPALAQALLVERLAPLPGDRVLLVGAAPHYVAAILQRLGAEPAVVTVPMSADQAGRDAAFDAVAAAGEPFALALVDNAVEEIPGAMAALLADGARVVTGLTDRGVMRLAEGRKVAGAVALRAFADSEIAAHPAFAAPRRWTF